MAETLRRGAREKVEAELAEAVGARSRPSPALRGILRRCVKRKGRRDSLLQPQYHEGAHRRERGEHPRT